MIIAGSDCDLMKPSPNSSASVDIIKGGSDEDIQEGEEKDKKEENEDDNIRSI